MHHGRGVAVAGKSSAPDDVITAHLSVRENSALSGGSRDSPYTSSREDSMQRSPTVASDTGPARPPTTGPTPATGSDVISLDAPTRPLPEVAVASRRLRDAARQQPEVDFF